MTYNKDIYLLHVYRARLEYPDLRRKLRELAGEFRAGVVIIEDTSAGTQLIQELQREGFARIIAIKPKGDKTMRMAAQTPMIEAGRVWLPRDAHWLPDYLHELAMFPKGKFDDQVDSTSQALAHVGMPSDMDSWMEMMREHELARYGLTFDNLTVTFDHSNHDTEFRLGHMRPIRREEDGFFHVTKREWESFRGMIGVILIEDSTASQGL